MDWNAYEGGDHPVVITGSRRAVGPGNQRTAGHDPGGRKPAEGPLVHRTCAISGRTGTGSNAGSAGSHGAPVPAADGWSVRGFQP